MSRVRCLLRLTAACLCLGSSALAQEDEDDELAPGLVSEYASGTQTARRIDGDLAFDWSTGSPDLRLPAGPFAARWSGQILLRQEGKYRWHAFLHGDVTVRLNDQVMLAAKSEAPQWVSGKEVDLSFGEFPLEIQYQSPGSGRLFLCWSSDAFPLEPLPHHVLFHERSELPRGPLLPAASAMLNHRCDRCHGGIAGLAAMPGPSLKHIGLETARDWLLDQIQHGGGEQGQMPKFGFDRQEAEAILAALQSRVEPLEWPASSVPAEIATKDIAAGRELLISTGCMACHQWEKQGRTGDFGGPPLDDVAKRRTAKWLEQWLTDPSKINARHRMPVFTLTSDERRQIISALLATQPPFAVSPPPSNSSPETLALGNKLLSEARCANCHELPGDAAASQAATSPSWREMKLEADGCWAENPAPVSRRPQFAKLNADELREFLRTTAQQQIEPAADLRGAALLVLKGCINCHDRDGRQGISSLAAELAKSTPNLEGRTMYLIPPQLTAVGDRLPDERLAQAIRGELLKRRLDWLLVRMPKYQHAEREQADIMAHLLSHDRIPGKAPASPAYPAAPGTEATFAGRELIGGKGFSCVACHPVKDFTPKTVALGTRGSNLFRIGERLRPDYFFRWTRSPLRVMPGVEMPSYQRPHPTIFPGDMNRQLAAIWTALNDPDLPTPVNPGAVEQYWTVASGDSPRILRDVVTLPGDKKSTIPRAFAVGFPNGHNVLFDLDTASLRAWTLGDFAQQRTQGKSWFWDLVGSPVITRTENVSDLQLVATGGKTVFPAPEAAVRLQHYQVDANGVSLLYKISVPGDRQNSKPGRVHVGELWQPAEHGWRRRIELLLDDPPLSGISFHLPAGALRPGGLNFDLYHIANGSQTKLNPRQSISLPFEHGQGQRELELLYVAASNAKLAAPPAQPTLLSDTEDVGLVPGFRGRRLPYPRNIMPTAITFDHQENLLFTSLKGHVYRGDDRSVSVFAEGLAAPFGILESLGMVVVAHKPEIVGLSDVDRDGKADTSTVLAAGWGLSDDYHDWTCGLVRDAEGSLYTTLGSDYADKKRPAGTSQWRGHAIKIHPAGGIESLARGLRYATGIAMTSQEHIFITDQQGVQNTFNELNWLDRSRPVTAGELRFGVPSLHEPDKDAPSSPPAVQIPHPWTRSVNGICAIPKPLADRTHPRLFDQILGCEYDNKALIRMSWQLVDGVMQGAVYPLSKPVPKPGSSSSRALSAEGSRADQSLSPASDNAPVSAILRPATEFLGPMSIAVSPDGDLYVGSIHDSGWQGGLNTGDVVKLTPSGTWPNGLCEIRVGPAGFDLEFFHPVDKARAEDKSRYQISGYARIWEGSYATLDSGRHAVEIVSAKLGGNGTTVSLTLNGLKPGHVYDVSIGDVGREADGSLWPNIGFYTLHRLPK